MHLRHPRRLAALAATLAAGAVVILTGPGAQAQPAPGHHGATVYFDQFTSLAGIAASQSGSARNALASPADTSNGQLQTPSLRADVQEIADPTAQDGHALAVYTRAEPFATPRGTWYGMTNGRTFVGGAFALAGHTVTVRLRGIGDGKAANMIWPAKGWTFEHDFAEWFPIDLTNVSVRNHQQQVQGAGAGPQIIAAYPISRQDWHVYGIEYLGRLGGRVTGIRYTFDGQPLTFHGQSTITDPRWLPGAVSGRLAIGKALPGERGSVPLSHVDLVEWDWARITTN